MACVRSRKWTALAMAAEKVAGPISTNSRPGWFRRLLRLSGVIRSAKPFVKSPPGFCLRSMMSRSACCSSRKPKNAIDGGRLSLSQQGKPEGLTKVLHGDAILPLHGPPLGLIKILRPHASSLNREFFPAVRAQRITGRLRLAENTQPVQDQAVVQRDHALAPLKRGQFVLRCERLKEL